MGRKYAVPFQGTLTNAGGDNDLLILLPADDKPIRLLGLVWGNFSEIGDAQEEVVRMSLYHMTATVTDGNGTSVTPTPCRADDTAAGFTAEYLGTTVATTNGTSTIKAEWAWNERMSPCELWWPDPDLAFTAIQGQALVWRCQTTVADDISFAGTAYVEEGF